MASSYGLDASLSSIEAELVRLSLVSVRGIKSLVSLGNLLNERQCRDLSSKLVKTTENFQQLVSHVGPAASITSFRQPFQGLHRILQKVKLLVKDCCNAYEYKGAPILFQIQNEEAFRQVLLEVGMCYNVIYEKAQSICESNSLPEDLRQSSTFLPASKNKVLEDERTFQKRLEDQLADNIPGSSHDHLNQSFTRYLLRRLKYKCEHQRSGQVDMSDEILWVTTRIVHLKCKCAIIGTPTLAKKSEWEFKDFLGGASGAICETTWFGIPCARKHFHIDHDAIFRKEAAILACLNHPNVVKFFCCGSDREKGTCFIGMELMEMSLFDLIKKRREKNYAGHEPFPILTALEVMLQIARGMCYLHVTCGCS